MKWSPDRTRAGVLAGVLLFALVLAGCTAPRSVIPPAADEVPPAAEQAVAAEDAAAPAQDPSIPADDPRSQGSVDAPVTIVEYSDFQCPFCSRWVEQTFPMILEDYIASGKVRLVFRDFPLSFHANADNAAVASRCAAEQGKYWEMHDSLFANQEAWAELADPADAFTSYAAEAGIDADAFRECLASGKFDQAIAEDFAAGEAAGVSGTPSFLINGQLLVGAQPAPVFQQALETILAGGSIVEPEPEVAEPPQPLDVPLGDAPVMGDADAPITIVEYSDYQCPFCNRFVSDTMPALVQQFVDTGKVKLVFKDFPLSQIHPQAQQAAEAARCVRELAGTDEAYWQMHDRLFAGQEEWAGTTDAAGIFVNYGTELGLASGDVEACLDSGRHAAAVQADFEEGLGLGVGGTPTFFINGQPLVGAQPFQNFQQAIAIVESGGSIMPPPQPTPEPPPTPAPLSGDVPLEDAAGIQGDPNAPVTIVEYSDYQCPFCQRHFLQTMPQLQPYIEDGTVLYVFKDFPLTMIHPQAPKAAEAARCAGEQDAYWEMHDKLFETQQEWAGQDDAVQRFKGYAGALGLDQAAFDTCLDSDKYQAVVEANLQEGAGYGVRGTPGFYVNRTPLPGAYPFEVFQQLIEAELAGQ